MTRITPETVDSFRGVAQDVPPPKLPDGLFQVDEGSDRFRRGSWRRRRGMRHSSLSKFSSAVTSILGFDLAGPDYGFLVVEGNNVHGFTNVTQQADVTDQDGYGVGGYGDGGYGA